MKLTEDELQGLFQAIRILNDQDFEDYEIFEGYEPKTKHKGKRTSGFQLSITFFDDKFDELMVLNSQKIL